MNIKDTLLKQTRALPASTATVTLGTPIDTEKSSTGEQLANVDFLLTAPVLTTAQLPDAKLMTYAIIMSDNADLSSPTTLYPGVLVQTGAGGAGAAANTFRFRIPTTAKRYIGFTVAPSASGTGDASAASATLEVVL